MHTDFLGVKVDKLTLNEAFDGAIILLKKPGKHLIVTTNVEFIMKAQEDPDFKNILNSADLSIPDSARFTWAQAELKERNLLKKIALLPFVFTKHVPGAEPFPIATGVDLMEEIIAKSQDFGFTTGLLGGKNGVAEKTKECLLKKYPKAKIVFAEAGGEVNEDGEGPTPSLPSADFVFVALGQVKQEKWIEKHQEGIPGKVFVGVGGAFDYLSGNVSRAPKFLRDLGLEWAYRGIIQPWRLKRFLSLIRFTFLILRAG